MNLKLNRVLLGILVVSLMVTAASAAHNSAQMAKPTSNSGVTGCSQCHSIGSPTTSGFCTGCHSFPEFKLAVAANPNTVNVGSSTNVAFTVTQYTTVTNNPTASSAASVTLSGAGVSTSGSTNSGGIATLPVNPTGAGTILATATKSGYTDGTTTVTANAAADTTTPVITMLGSTPVSIVVGSAYVDAGATASDNKDGVLTSKIVTVNSVNAAVIGSYKVTYNVADAAGNKAVEVVRTVNVVAATTPPTGTFSVTFKVIDSINGKPIHEAKVSIGRVTKKTNDDGKVTFRNIVSGARYKISKEGYLTITDTVKSTNILVKLVKVNHEDDDEEEDD